ncbi:hypothetical protein [Roseibium sp. SCP14]|uniref:hypothetical protein n=1 Tax=Roseibium sp. SCP14 TaxID=3141375 RepID=UPI00333DDC9C
MVISFLISLLASAGGIIGFILAITLLSAFYSVGIALICITTALVYARLREIKEGIGVDQIATVFD